MSQRIEDVLPPWSEGLIMICTKCGRKLGSEEISNNLKEDLKSLVSAQGFEKKIRVVTSSCLDICPDGRITVAFASHGQIKTVTVEKEVEPQDLLKHFLPKK